MIEKEQSYEKQNEEKIRRELKEEIKRELKEEKEKKKGKSRKTAGVYISIVGSMLYLLFGLIFLIMNFGYIGYMFRSTIAMLIAAGISLAGVITASYKVKIGGGIILISIPIAFVIGILLPINEPYYYSYYQWIYLLQFIVFPLPIPHSVHIIAGAIICLTATDE